MKLFTYGFTPLQQGFATLAIFAMVFGPFAGVNFASAGPAVTETTTTVLNAIATPLTPGQTNVPWSGSVLGELSSPDKAGLVVLQVSSISCSSGFNDLASKSLDQSGNANPRTWSGATFTAPATPGTYYIRAHFNGVSQGQTTWNASDSACRTVSVESEIATFTLTYTAGANGSITGTTPQNVEEGQDGTAVTAVPDSGYIFVDWSDSSTANPRTDLNVTGNIAVTANFTSADTGTVNFCHAPSGDIEKAKKYLDAPVSAWGGHSGHIGDFLILNQADEDLCDAIIANEGTIVVDKITVPAEDAQSFTFSTGGTGYVGFSLSDTATPNSQTLTAGSYSVSEGAVTGWTQTSAVCVSSILDTETPGALELDAGEIITCTFTNTKNGTPTGTIIVDKVTVPAADAQSFTFTTTGTGYNGFSLADADTVNSQTLGAGSYTVAEDAVTGWTQTSAVCVSSILDTETPGALELDEDETITCTFTNTRDTGSLTILKDTDDVSGDQVLFDFSGTGGIGSFGVLGNSIDSETFNLPTGQYTVTELDEADWTFGSVTCDEGASWDNTTDGVIVNLDKNDDVTCTFVNTKDTTDDTTITINKVTNVESTDAFGFFLDDSSEANATLAGGETSGAIVVTPGSHNIVEGVAAGWTLDKGNSSCVNEAQQVVGSFDGNPYYLTLAEGDDIVCTFTNTKDLPPPPVCRVGSNLLTNASFESPAVTANGGQWEIFGTVANWVISLSDGLELWNNLMGSASDGEQNAELDGTASTQITQNVATIPGATYELRFDFSARPDADSAVENSIDALINGVTLMNATADGTDIGTNTWATHAQTFVAAGTSTDVSFKDIGTSNGLGSLIDNAVLCLVSEPEPAKACSLNVVSDTSNTVTEKGAINALEVVSEPGAWVDGIVDSLAQWIWGSPAASAIDPEVDETQTFVKTFNWNGPVTSANLQISSDNGYSVTMNGTLVVTDTNEFSYSVVDTIDLTSYIVTGENKLEISVTNNANGTIVIEDNPAGLLYDLTVVGNNDVDCKVVPEPDALSCTSFTSSASPVRSGQEFTLTWDTNNATGVSISGITGPLAVDGTYTTSVSSDTTFVLTASRDVDEEVPETVTCSVAIDVQSSGGGGGGSRGSRRSSSDEGEVLGASTSRDPEVLGASTTAMPLGAPNTGSGGTSLIVVNLPTLFAVLGARTLVRKVK